MRAGQLNQVIVIEKKLIPETQDSFGAPQEDWTPDTDLMGAAQMLAAFEPLGSNEFHTAWKRFSETTARFRIRYVAGLDPDKHRITWIHDRDASPVVTSIWDIYPPLPVAGKLKELHIEAREIK